MHCLSAVTMRHATPGEHCDEHYYYQLTVHYWPHAVCLACFYAMPLRHYRAPRRSATSHGHHHGRYYIIRITASPFITHTATITPLFFFYHCRQCHVINTTYMPLPYAVITTHEWSRHHYITCATYITCCLFTITIERSAAILLVAAWHYCYICHANIHAAMVSWSTVSFVLLVIGEDSDMVVIAMAHA